MKKIRKTVFCFIVLLLLAVVLNNTFNFIIKIMYPLKYEDSIIKYSEEYGFDRYFIMAVIKTESNFDSDAYSGVAHGVMQITDDTAQWIAKRLELEFESADIKNPETNIRMGCYYLDYLSDIYSDRDVVLACYNAGMGNVSKWLKDSRYSKDGTTLYHIPFEETREYIEKINKYEEIYKKIYKDERKG